MGLILHHTTTVPDLVSIRWKLPLIVELKREYFSFVWVSRGAEISWGIWSRGILLLSEHPHELIPEDFLVAVGLSYEGVHDFG